VPNGPERAAAERRELIHGGIHLDDAAVVLLAVIIVSTVPYQAPQHARLSSGLDAAAYRTLNRSNWVRTVAWSELGVLDLWLIWQGVSHS
jgi:hypothetical protein